MIDMSIDRCSWKSVAPLIASGETSLRIVRMIAPVAAGASWRSWLSASPSTRRRPPSTRTPARDRRSRQAGRSLPDDLNRGERVSRSVLIMRSLGLREP